MARAAFVTRAIDEAGNAVGGSPTEVRIWDDFGASVASVVTDDAAGGTTITQPMVPNAGTQTTLTVTTGTGDTTLTVASTTGFAVGQLIPIYDGTNTRYRWIRAILSGPPRLTIESAIGVVFSNANTSVGNPDMLGVIGGYVTDSTYHYIQTKDVASTRVMPPTLISTFIGIQSLAILEEGAAAGTRPTLNFISPFITASDNAPSTRVDVIGPTAGVAPTTSAVGDAAAEGTNTTIGRSDHRHGREAFATNAIVLGTAAAAGAATTLMRRDDTIAAFDATAPTVSALADVAAVGVINFAARRDHKHGRETSGITILDKIVATTTVVNTTTETDLYRKTVNGNTIGANGLLRLTLWGDYLNNSGGGTQYRFKVIFGGTTVLDSGLAQSIASQVNRGGWQLQLMLWNTGTTNSQRVSAFLSMMSGGAVFGLVSGAADVGIGDGTATEDTTAAKDLAFRIIMQSANASLDMRAKEGLLELLT